MKKNYFLGALLLGIFILTSCVDNEESLSVEELRKSKSELLKSQAALNAAEAEAVKILAAADAALKNAQAEAEKANALKIAAETEIIKLQADLQETENEQAKVELANELERQKVIKAESEARLKQIANQLLLDEQQLQADLARTEANLLQAQKDLADLKDDLSEAEKAKLQKLSAKYISKVSELNNAKQALSSLKTQLIQVENDLVSLEESKAKDIAQNNRNIARYKAEIEVYKQYAGYNGDPQELWEVAKAKQREWDVALNNGNIASLQEKYDGLWSKTYEKLQPVHDTDFYKVISDWPFSQYVSFPSAYYIGNGLGYKWEQIENEDLNWWYSYDGIVSPVVEDLRPLEIQIRNIELDVEWYDDYINNETSGLTKQYADAVTASATAKEAWENAKGTPDEWSKQNDYQIAIQNENNVKSNLESAQSNLEYFQNELERYQNAYDVLNDAGKLAKIKTAIDTYNAQFTGVAEAFFVWQKAEADADILLTEYYALLNIYVDASQIDEWITSLEDSIKGLEADNADTSAITSQEEWIDRLKSTIAAQERDVAVKQKAADEVKEALDEALTKE